jgi:F0F1-type ATP synthase membrane subunit a
VAIELQPLEQFTIERIVPIHIGGLDLSYTNAALMMTIAVIAVTALMVFATRKAALVPGRWQSVAEMSYEFVADMIDTNIGHGGRQFFPFIFTLFMFILFANLLGMIPYSYTTTSQIIVTFALAAVVFILVTTIGIVRHGFHSPCRSGSSPICWPDIRCSRSLAVLPPALGSSPSFRPPSTSRSSASNFSLRYCRLMSLPS